MSQEFQLDRAGVTPFGVEGQGPVPQLQVMHHDRCFAVIIKPAGLLSCPGRGADKQDSVQTRVPQVFAHAHGPLLVHRLDQATSGIMVVALTTEAYHHLQRQFAARQVHKVYVAELEGQLTGDQGRIELPFRVDVDRRPHQMHDPVHGKMGVTLWRVLARRGQRTRVEFVPLTGRTHQLRVHAAHPLGLGAPIAGDALYGDASAAPRLLLHASQIAFAHPQTGNPVTYVAPVPF